MNHNDDDNSRVHNKAGELYVVATPIGNLDDISFRAVEVLRQVDLILAEDTRHAKRLLTRHAIDTPMQSFHEHNEAQRSAGIIEKLQHGKQIALISDAGTPLISDPGYPLIHAAREQSLRVTPIPGANAMITALSAAGLATDRFSFEGFLPARETARQHRLETLRQISHTQVFYESSHRILACLNNMREVFGPQRQVVVARELTKKFESWYQGNLERVLEQLQAGSQHSKGEFVILLAGAGMQFMGL